MEIRHNIKEVRRKLGDIPDEVDKATTESVREDLVMTKAAAIDNINMGAPDERIAWRGPLSASLTVTDQMNSSGMRTFKFQTEPSIAPYAAVVEFGSGQMSDATKAAFEFEAPEESGELLAELTEWVDEKGITPDNPSIPQSQLPGAIMDSMSEKGQHPHPYFRPAWHEHEVQLVRNLQRAVGKGVSRAVR